jgi:hypothetical protein
VSLPYQVEQSNKILEYKRFCYSLTSNTTDNSTSQILPEIFITSLCHSESFKETTDSSTIDSFLNLLADKSITETHLVTPLTQFCKSLLSNETSVLLNPDLGGELDNINVSIPAEADILIGKTLFDIKCTKTEKSVFEILQLLGYSALLRLNKRDTYLLDKVSIINLYHGTLTMYDISTVKKENFLEYLKILSNMTD